MLAVLALTASCQGARDTIKNRLYPAEGDGGWSADSTLLASKPAFLYRVIVKNGQQYILPIANLADGDRNLHLSARGWRALDSSTMWENKTVYPVRDGRVGEPVKMQRGMWQNPAYALDSVPGCPGVQIPIGQLSVGDGVSLVVSNYKAPAGLVTLDANALQRAIDAVPTLVTPTLGVSAAMLTRYRRTVHQIPFPNKPPQILLEYNDPDPVLDTGSTRGKRPRSMVILMAKGVYAYHPSWIYSTTKMKGDVPALHFLDAIDVTGDGIPELFFSPEVDKLTEYTFQYRQWNDTWRQTWRRSPGRCDL
jgi:hypothetical protein